MLCGRDAPQHLKVSTTERLLFQMMFCTHLRQRTYISWLRLIVILLLSNLVSLATAARCTYGRPSQPSCTTDASLPSVHKICFQFTSFVPVGMAETHPVIDVTYHYDFEALAILVFVLTITYTMTPPKYVTLYNTSIFSSQFSIKTDSRMLRLSDT